MEIAEFEEKRADNLIWNAAGDYSLAPDFHAYDDEGRAQLYWNSLIGAACRHYEWDKLRAFYETFRKTRNREWYENLFWIALECSVFELEAADRPVFPWLRREYAGEELVKLSRDEVYEEAALYRTRELLRAHMEHVLAEDDRARSGRTLPDVGKTQKAQSRGSVFSRISPRDRALLLQIESIRTKATDEWISELSRILTEYFGYGTEADALHEEKQIGGFLSKLPFLSGLGGGKNAQSEQETEPVRALAFGWGEHLYEYTPEDPAAYHKSVNFMGGRRPKGMGLQDYIAHHFGTPLYTAAEVRSMEQEYCTQNHKGCHLYFTRGDYTKEMLRDTFAGTSRNEALRQRRQNAEDYEKHADRYQVQIAQLTDRLRNSILMHLEEERFVSRTGVLVGNRMWRGLLLSDDRVFIRTVPGDTGNLTVDLLLDASTSQESRRKTVSAQGYMIAESLTRCGIPVRVLSFCSMSGYTIMTRYRDYGEIHDNDRIFRYSTAGANRDGLAIRLCRGLLEKNSAEHRLLIAVSDCKPYDMIKIQAGRSMHLLDYDEEAAVSDVAAQVHACRMENIAVMCVFTGEDSELPAARRIYGRSFVRIRDMSQFADAVSALITAQIESM